ncbi:plakophilin-3-like [Megalops cyprinoides]|uniref:plakophilin-3-like n=1 Tax=Megalops cyprinoides TaxID=118141 RepID=UPI001864229A|nr:plakophilin-3-like [Megalops cyprinoides]
MSVSVPSDVFLSAIAPNTTVSTYAVPSETQLENGGSHSDEDAKAKRVQQQVQMRLAEKLSKSLPQINGCGLKYASSEYGDSSTIKYSTFNPGFSKSHLFTMGRIMVPRTSQYAGSYSSRSAMEMRPERRISMGGRRWGSMYHEDMSLGGYQTSRQQGISRAMSQADLETMSMHSMHLNSLPQQPTPVAAWMSQDDGEGSLVSDMDGTITHQPLYSASNDYIVQTQQTAPSVSAPTTMHRSLSGTLCRGVWGGGGVEVMHQYSFKGPAHRTISRINNRHHRMSMGSISGSGVPQRQMSSRVSRYGGGYGMGQMSTHSQGNLLVLQHQPASGRRALSVKSLCASVGKGMDILDGDMEMTGLSRINSLDMLTAVNYLTMPDAGLQVLGAAYLQHECYHKKEAKNQVRELKGITALVQLFESDNQEVQRYATGAMRNIIYENMENKAALIEAGGISKLIEALKETDDELRKNITGILWNLSSKDSLKEKLAEETLSVLTKMILIPLSGSGDSEVIQQSPSEADIVYNTTGCLRNLSSVNEKTRQQMRETSGLVDALVEYIQNSLQNDKMEEKGIENAVCVLRNLSYQLYSEMPPSALLRLEGPTRGQNYQSSEAIGCFTPQSKKAKDKWNQDLAIFTEVARQPKGQEWLWHPQVVGLYNQVLQRCKISSTSSEAAAGALQNITAGDKRWAMVLSRVALEQERMLPVVVDHLRSHSDLELRSITGFLRNLSRHAKDKTDMATKVVNSLVSKLPSDGHQKEPSSDVVVNICGILNNLVTCCSIAARYITIYDGLPKLVAIKTSHSNRPEQLNAAKAAATVLTNMFQYKKLRKDYKQRGFTKHDFMDII